MTEINGLRNILSEAGTMHGLREPPERDDYSSDDEYQHAHDEWWIAMHCWSVTVSDTP